jgi:CcmD family protein
MCYLVLGFSIVWVCHFTYLFVIDRQARQLHRRLDARERETPGCT